MSPVSTPLSLLPGEPSTTFKQTEIYVFNKIRLVDLSFFTSYSVPEGAHIPNVCQNTGAHPQQNFRHSYGRVWR